MPNCAHSGDPDIPVQRRRRATGSQRPEPVAIGVEPQGNCNAHVRRPKCEATVSPRRADGSDLPLAGVSRISARGHRYSNNPSPASLGGSRLGSGWLWPSSNSAIRTDLTRWRTGPNSGRVDERNLTAAFRLLRPAGRHRAALSGKELRGESSIVADCVRKFV